MQMAIILINNTGSNLMQIVWDDMKNYAITHEINEEFIDIFEYAHFSKIDTKEECVKIDFK